MKTKLQSLILGLALCAGLHQTTAQVILNPNQIQGNLRFTNTNPAILAILGAPGNFGIADGEIYAYSQPPASSYEESAVLTPQAGGLVAPYQITVESGNPGIEYSVAPYAINETNDAYYFSPLISLPVVSNTPAVSLDFNECVTLLNFIFEDAAGNLVPVNVANITATIPGYGLQAQSYRPPSASLNPGPALTNRYFIIRGGTNYSVEIQYDVGTNIYANQVQFQLITNITAVADQIMPIKCVVPAASAFGSITGMVSLAGEFLLRTGGYPPYPERTVVEAYNGPFGNQRWATVPGTNFTVASSGAFALTNLPASALASPTQGYSVHAEMEFRTNFQYSWFRTPGLGEGANPPVMVTGGGTVNLASNFAIIPGYIDGSVVLQGPAENGVTNSIFRGVLRSIQGKPSPDGIPHPIAAAYGNEDSEMGASGVDSLAPGATLTAVNGECIPSLQGDFNPLTSAFEGSYEAVVGGLNSQNSLWQANGMQLLLEDPNYASDYTNGNYYDGYVAITDLRTNNIEVVAGQHYTNNVAYCFSEVQLGFTTTSGTFFAPEINYPSRGTFTGTNFQGHAANYVVDVYDTYGTPAFLSTATNSGLLRMALPQGTYTLYPSVEAISPDGKQSDTGLSPITLTVGCQQRISLTECLQINVNLPACTTNSLLPVNGAVRSCTNVTLITYQLNNGPTNTVCNNCGVNPGFFFELNLASAGLCATNTVVITAYGANGEVSSITSQIRFNNVPPTINCPADIVIFCVNTNQVPVTFNVTASSNCGLPATITCIPPSGSFFPAGTNTVTCSAMDGCGNQSTCSFHVIVLSQLVSIQNAVIISWGCGILQNASNANGPWTDVTGATSPYCVPVTQSKLFYRTRQ